MMPIRTILALIYGLLGFFLMRTPALAEEKYAEQVLTLDESIQRASQNNQRLLLVQEEIRISEQRVQEARSQLLPKIGLNFNGSRYLAERDYVLPTEFGSTLLRPSRGLSADTFYSARAFLKQPLYSGGRTKNTVRLAEADLQRALIQYEEVRGQVILGVVRSFYDVLLSRKEMQLYEDADREVESQADRVVPDAAHQAELQAIRLRLRRGLSEKRRGQESARLKFLDALGLELYTNVDLEGELKTTRINLDLAKLLARAQESRLEIRRTDYQREIDRLALNLSQAERYPVVEFGAGYELNDRAFPLETTQWNATLNVSLPLFDGFSSRARIRQKRMRTNQSRIQRADVEDQINLEVRESYGELMYWQEEMAVREEDLRRTESALTPLRADKGPLDRIRAQEWLLQARQSYWKAVYEHRVSLAKLEKAVGRSLSE